MEDFQLDLIIGEGPAARSVRIDLPPFTLVAATTRAGLIINATSLGMKGDTPLPATAFRPGQLVIDLAYGPDETPLVRTARAASAEAVDGREMLLGQGAAAFTLWTGRSAPIAVMRAALEAALLNGTGGRA